MDLIEADRSIHKNRDQCRGLSRGIPAIYVMSGIRLSDAEFLRFLQRFIKGQPLFHLAEDYVRGRVQDSMKALQVNGREFAEKRKDRGAIHHRGLEQEALAFLAGKVAEFTIGVYDGAFVRGDGMGAMFERSPNVAGGGLASFHIERRGLEENVGFGRREPISHIRRPGRVRKALRGYARSGQVQAS